MSAQLAILLGALAPALLGWPLTALVGGSSWSRAHWMVRVSQSWLVGCLTIGAVEFGWLLLHKGAGWSWFTEQHIVWGLLGLAVVSCVLVMRRRFTAEPPLIQRRPETIPRWERFVYFGSLLVAVGSMALLCAAVLPLPSVLGDEGNFWAARGRALHLVDDLSAESMLPMRLTAFHLDYPLWNPMLQMWMHQQVDDVLYVSCRFPLQGFSVLSPLLVAGVLRQHLRPAAAGVLTLWVTLHPVLTMYGAGAESDVMLGFSLLVMVDAWLRWREHGAAGDARLVAFAAAAVAWSKNEGSMLLFGFAIAVAVARMLRLRVPQPGAEAQAEADRPAKWQLLPWLTAPLAVVVASRWWNSHHEFDGDLFGDSFTPELAGMSFTERMTSGGGERAEAAARYFGNLMIDRSGLYEHPGGLSGWFQSQTIVPVLGLLTLAAGWKSWRDGRVGLPILTALAGWSGYILVFAGTPHDLDWHLKTAATRTVWHPLFALTPALAVVAAAAWPALGRQGSSDRSDLSAAEVE